MGWSVNKSIISNICKVLVFALILGIVMCKTSDVLGEQDDTYTTYGFDQFYNLPENSVDVMTLGSSGMREFYNVNEAYAHNGIACATMATSGQPFVINKYLIEETEKTQHPKVYVIDIRQLEYSDDTNYLTCLRRASDSMRFSKTRLDMIDRAIEIALQINPDQEVNKLDYYFSYFLYHSRWDELTALDFGNYSHISWMGFSIFSSISYKEKVPNPISYYTEPMELTDLHLEELNEVLDYCKELNQSQGTQFLFIDSIAWAEERHYQRALTIKQIIEDAGFPFIDTREWFDEMGFDLATDFRDNEHVNVWGSFKYTDFMADYLQLAYDLEDHRGDETYAVWQENYQRFIDAFNIMEAQRAQETEQAE